MEEKTKLPELHGAEREKATRKKYYSEHKEQFRVYKQRYAEKYPEKAVEHDQGKYLAKIEREGGDVQALLDRRERVEFFKDQPKWVKYAWRNHGNYISWSDFKAVVPRLADGPCDICGKTGERMVLDHCHKKMALRGALCAACNIALGHLRDDPELIQKAIAYLKRAN